MSLLARFLIFSLPCLVSSLLYSYDFSYFDCYQNRLTYEEIKIKIENYLEKDPEIKKFYQLTPEAFQVGDLEHGQTDYVLHLKPASSLNQTASILPGGCVKRSDLRGMKIALDPGHFGGMFAELEERYVKIPAEHTKDGQPLCFYEGDLTYLTALELKRLLEAEGAIVFMTRSGLGKGALEQDFFSWLMNRSDLVDTLLSRLFRNEYNREDLRKRAEKINAFKPDITVIIHYNAHLSESEKKARLFFTQSNYNLAFVPGAFGKGEMKESEDRYEFLRLIATNDIENSIKLSEYVVAEFVNQLQVPLIAHTEKNSYLSSVCLFQKEGIYSRNLALTRLIHGPLCYGETLIQNNQEEAYKLSSRDSFIQGIPCSKRVEQVALAYFEGIKHYFTP